MASQQGQGLSQKAGEAVGQAQVKKDEYMNKASDALNRAQEDSHTDHSSSYASQASNLLQQTGEQVKSMAQGAAEAVKNTLGMNGDDNRSSGTAATTTNPHNPSTRI